MDRQYSRVPRVTRLEYLIDLLKGVEKGYDRQRLEQVLSERKTWFEAQKYQALGRGRPFMKALRGARNLLADSIKMATQMGYAEYNSVLRLTEEGQRFLFSDGEEQNNSFASKFLNIYYVASELLVVLLRQPDEELEVPDTSHLEDTSAFQETLTQHRIKTDVFTFKTIRDILSQLGIVNWFKLRRDGFPYMKVYPTSFITDNRAKPGTISFTYLDTNYCIEKRRADQESLTKAIWTEYMAVTKDIPLRPAFYSNLRERVCYKLRISDKEFDSSIRMLMNISNAPFRVIWSSGTLPYSRDSAGLIKSLPPKSEQGQYMIYLKIAKR